MRLTLRTLLAYLDGQLTEADAAEIEEKIEKSEFAQKLKRRIGMLLGRRNLTTPKMLGRGIVDPNLVARYLDNTMPPEQVADFEKACLESDIQLAEVVACHQILITLGQTKTVAPELRQRIYRLNKFLIDEIPSEDSDSLVEQHGEIQERFVDSPAEQIVYGDDVFELAPPSHLQNALHNEQDEQDPGDPIDAQLKTGGAWRIKVLPVLASVASLSLLTLIIIWSTRDGNQDASNKTPDQTAEGQSLERGEIAKLDNSAPSKKLDAISDAEANQAETGINAKTIEPPPESKSNPADKTDVKTNVDAKDKAISKHDIDNRKVIEIAFDTDAKSKVVPKIPAKDLAATFFGIEPEPAGEPVAKLEASGELLARIDSQSGLWSAVSPDSQLQENEFILTFPFFRPRIVFSDVVVTPCDAGIAEILPRSDKNLAQLSLHQGKFLFQLKEGTFAELVVNAGGVSATITLQNEQSIVAIDVRRHLPPGLDPASQQANDAAITIVQVFGAEGTSVWVDEKQVTRLEKNLCKIYINGAEINSGMLQSQPTWAAGDFISEFEPSDRKAVFALASSTADLKSALQEGLSTDAFKDQIRARLLTELCLLQLGQGPSLISLLDNPAPAYTRLWSWRSAIEIARQHLFRSPSSAATFKDTFGQDPQGDSVSRILYAFSNQQLASGTDVKLVQLLEDERLAMRVIAHQTLWKITGDPLLFRPETNDRVRARHLESWKKSLAAGQILSADENILPIYALVPAK